MLKSTEIIAMHSLHYNIIDISIKHVQTKTQIFTKLTGRHVEGGAGKP